MNLWIAVSTSERKITWQWGMCVLGLGVRHNQSYVNAYKCIYIYACKLNAYTNCLCSEETLWYSSLRLAVKLFTSQNESRFNVVVDHFGEYSYTAFLSMFLQRNSHVYNGFYYEIEEWIAHVVYFENIYLYIYKLKRVKTSIA